MLADSARQALARARIIQSAALLPGISQESSMRYDMDMEWDDQVRLRAYAIWEREGRPEEGAERHWIQAEEELRAEEQERTEAPAMSITKAGTGTEPDGSAGGELQAGTEAGEDLPRARRGAAREQPAALPT
jgi:hypothetical protein